MKTNPWWFLWGWLGIQASGVAGLFLLNEKVLRVQIESVFLLTTLVWFIIAGVHLALTHRLPLANPTTKQRRR